MFFWDSVDSHNKGMEMALGCYSFAFNLMPFTFVFHFSADVKKPGSFESDFLVFEAW